MSDEDSPPDIAPGETTSEFDSMASLHASRGDTETLRACSPLATPDPDWKAAHALNALKRVNTLEFGGDPLTPGKVLDFEFSLGADGASGINSPALSGSATFNAVLVDADDDLPVVCHAASSASRPVPSPAEAPPKKKPKKKRKARTKHADAAERRRLEAGTRDPATTAGDFPALQEIRAGLEYVLVHTDRGAFEEARRRFGKSADGMTSHFSAATLRKYEAQFQTEHGGKSTAAQLAALENWWPFCAKGKGKGKKSTRSAA